MNLKCTSTYLNGKMRTFLYINDLSLLNDF